MKNILIFLSVFLLYNTHIKAQFGVPYGYEGSLNDRSYLIKKGNRANDQCYQDSEYSLTCGATICNSSIPTVLCNFLSTIDLGIVGIRNIPIAAVKLSTTNRHMKFKVRFDKGIKYSNNFDWNKAMMITYPNGIDRQDFKMHLGWRFNSERNALELSLFYHENGYWVSHYMKTAKVNPEDGSYEDVFNNVSMQIGKTTLGMVIDDKALGIRKGGNYYSGTRSSYMMKFMYFGGKKYAPHDMEFKTEDVYYDSEEFPFQNDFDNASIQQWNLTNFWDGDYFEFHASDEMIGSTDLHIKDYPLPVNPNTLVDVVYKNAANPDSNKAYCILHNGSTIIFKAGNRVLLKPGFHADKGSHFLGKIEAKGKKSGRMASQNPFDETLPSIWPIEAPKDVILKNLINTGKVAEHITVFPNPANQVFQFKNTLPVSVKGELHSKNGVLVKEFNVKSESTFHVNTIALKSGYYILNIYSGKQKIMEKKILVTH